MKVHIRSAPLASSIAGSKICCFFFLAFPACINSLFRDRNQWRSRIAIAPVAASSIIVRMSFSSNGFHIVDSAHLVSELIKCERTVN